MLLYVSTGDPGDRQPRPLHTIPDTVPKLYDLGMREHARASVLTFREGADWVETPDWRFDRQVIRIALYCRERLHLAPEERVALFGPAGHLWLAADFAIQGLGATAVGISHLLSDDLVAAALAEAGARIAFATDEGSARRLLALRPRTRVAHVVAPLASGEDPVVPFTQLMALADTLDTAERAQQFRTRARAVLPDQPALWHCEPGRPVARLTQREAMEPVRERLVTQSARPEDRTYFEAAAVTLAARLAGYAFVGDGHTTTVLGDSARAFDDVAAVRPATVLASAAWVDELRARLEATPRGRWERWAAGVPALDWFGRRSRQRQLRRAGSAQLGGRLRSLECLGPVAEATARLLAEAGVPLRAATSEAGRRAQEEPREVSANPHGDGGPHLRPAT